MSQSPCKFEVVERVATPAQSDTEVQSYIRNNLKRLLKGMDSGDIRAESQEANFGLIEAEPAGTAKWRPTGINTYTFVFREYKKHAAK